MFMNIKRSEDGYGKPVDPVQACAGPTGYLADIEDLTQQFGKTVTASPSDSGR
jgi:hypothetical protein